MKVPIACVIGWPIKHSRSPAIHRFWLNEFRIVGDYVVQPVEPDKVAAFFKNFPSGSYVGCNVTVPHKEAAFAAMNRLEPAAKAIGAVNTVWMENRELHGDNTDAAGFLANLDQEAPDWDRYRPPAVVLGAGGAARAVVWALLQRRLGPIHLVNRNVARAEALALRSGRGVRPGEWRELPDLLPDAGLLVNATSLGMEGQPPLEIDLGKLPAVAVVADLVYVPLETPLLAAARARGLRAVDGLGMLLHQ
ncbi:MAG TPA: shikimate dehydrogenase, partial [Bauldia sp.]|nr:shikimate dehydrogenase [Bauldia sp.]